MNLRHVSSNIAGAGLVISLALLGGPSFLPALSSGEALAQEMANVVTQVDVIPASGGDEDRVVIYLDGAISEADVTVTKVDENTWQAEMKGVVPGRIGDDINGAGDLISRVKIAGAEGGDNTRITVNMTRAGTHQELVVRSGGGQVQLLFTAGQTGGDDVQAAAGPSNRGELEDQEQRGRQAGAVSGPTAAQAAALASLDFENLDDISRIVIGTSGSPDYSSSQPDPNLVVVDFPGLRVPQSLQRPLDTSEFVSPVRMVRAYKTRSGARVAISLRRGTSWNVRQGPDNLVYVDFDVPEGMENDRRVANQGFSNVAPGAPQDNGMHGVASSEILIGESGRTVNPQMAFGTGRGASDPSSLALGSMGMSFDSNSATRGNWTGRRINIDLVEADIHSVFRLISHVSRLNIVAGDDVAGAVTVRLENVPWDQALAAILQAKGLAAQRFGNIIRVAPIETIKAEQQAALETKRAADELESLSILVVPLNYSQADDLVEQVESMITPRGSVRADSRTNQLVIQETDGKLATIRELLRQVDRQTPQVLIEARIVEATSRFARSLGIQWGGELNASAATGYSTGVFFPNSVGIGGGFTGGTGNQLAQSAFYSPGQDNIAVDLGADGANSSLAFSLGSIPGLVNLDARLSAMETEGWGEIISSPRVTTLDNTEARISQGARIPYLSTSAGGTQVQFVQAALELSVTPHITSDGKIFMEITVSNNRADFSNTVQGQPALVVKEASTELLISDGDTTVIGGVFATEYAESSARVPFLSRIPLLGLLFKNSTKSESRNEMLVFVTPRIVTRTESN